MFPGYVLPPHFDEMRTLIGGTSGETMRIKGERMEKAFFERVHGASKTSFKLIPRLTWRVEHL